MSWKQLTASSESLGDRPTRKTNDLTIYLTEILGLCALEIFKSGINKVT